MYCTQCGKEINENFLFCNYCGAKVIRANEQKQERSPEKSEANNITQKTEKVTAFSAQKLIDVKEKIQKFCKQHHIARYISKVLLPKIILLLLVIGVTYLAQEDLLNEGRRAYSLEETTEEVLEYLEVYEKFDGETVANYDILLKLSWKLFQLGKYILFAAIVFALFHKEKIGIRCVVINFIITVTFFALEFFVVIPHFTDNNHFVILDFWNEQMWLYIVLNIVLLIFAFVGLSNARTSRIWIHKGYSLFENVQERDDALNKQELTNNQLSKNEVWRCADCGKINPHYVSSCSCGRSREGNE